MFEQTHEAFLAQQKKKTLRIVDHLEGDTMHEWLLLVKPRGRTTIRARTSMPGFEFAMYGEDYPEQAAYIQKQIENRGIQVPAKEANEMLMLVRVFKKN